MDSNKKVFIELTNKQKKKLGSLFAEVILATIKEKPIMLLAQIYQTNDGDTVAICNVLTHQESIDMQELLSPKDKGQYVGHDYAVKALQKARK